LPAARGIPCAQKFGAMRERTDENDHEQTLEVPAVG